MSDHIHENFNDDGVDRRGFLKCMAWAGTGLVFTMTGGIASSRRLLAAATGQSGGTVGGDFTFVQISDSHIGFNKEANTTVIGTMQEAIGRIKALPKKPDLIIHTGDLTHLAEADEFDTVDQILKGTGVSDIFYVPENMMSLATSESNIAIGLRKGLMGTAGIVSLIMVFIL